MVWSLAEILESMFKASRAEDLSSGILPSALLSTIHSYLKSTNRQRIRVFPVFGRSALNYGASFHKAPFPHRTICWISVVKLSTGLIVRTNDWPQIKWKLVQAVLPVSLKGKRRNMFWVQPVCSTVNLSPFLSQSYRIILIAKDL